MLEKPSRNSLPKGHKENTYFVINNTNNVTRIKSGKQLFYWDDCGAHCKITTTKFYFRVSSADDLRTIAFKNNKYCSTVRKSSKTNLIPMVPQPDSKDILMLSKKYAKLKKRRLQTSYYLEKAL